MERCTSQDQPVGTGIRLELSNQSETQVSDALQPVFRDLLDSLAIKVLQPMTLIDDDVFPQKAREELLVVHTDFVCRDDNGE